MSRICWPCQVVGVVVLRVAPRVRVVHRVVVLLRVVHRVRVAHQAVLVVYPVAHLVLIVVLLKVQVALPRVVPLNRVLVVVL